MELEEIIVGKDAVLVVIDVVKDICADGFRYDKRNWDRQPILEMTDRLLPFIQKTKGKIKIVFVNSEYTIDQFKDDPYPITDFCIAGTQGTNFYKLDSRDADFVYTKHHWSAFLHYPYEEQKTTEMHEWLQNIGVKQIIMTGLTFTHCISSNVGHALQLGYQVILPRDLVASRGERMRMSGIEGHIAKLKIYEEHPQVMVVDSANIKYL